MDDDDGGGDVDNVLVEGQVLDYLELPDSCDARLQKTCYEHYPLHHTEVLDGGGKTDDNEEEEEDNNIITGIIVNTKIGTQL